MDDLPTAFTVWAAVVGMIGLAIVYELAKLRAELKEMAEKMNDYIVVMERRMTHVESHLERNDSAFRPALGNYRD
jgi:cell division protein ZapA (FtsZ GTPase activity inhibitor)